MAVIRAFSLCIAVLLVSSFLFESSNAHAPITNADLERYSRKLLTQVDVEDKEQYLQLEAAAAPKHAETAEAEERFNNDVEVMGH